MDSFEGLVRLVAEDLGYWTRQSHKVNLSKEEKRDVGKPSIPRPEIDLLLFDATKKEVIALEVKSFLDSPGVPPGALVEKYEVPKGNYKLFTSDNYRRIVFQRLSMDLVGQGLIESETEVRLGLAAGKIKRNEEREVRELCESNGWFFLGPTQIKNAVRSWSGKGYENSPYLITAKIALR